MMQYADCLDDLETFVKIAEFEDVRLGKINALQAVLCGTPEGKGQTGQTQVHGQQTAVFEAAGGSYWMAATATSGDHYSRLGRPGYVALLEIREQTGERTLDRCRVTKVSVGPARIGILFVLLPNAFGHCIVYVR